MCLCKSVTWKTHVSIEILKPTSILSNENNGWLKGAFTENNIIPQ